ncbi:DUF6183 family protein [Streptomyces sp. NPDC047097]|uniref:DUF6183 family protein n=1 Tax=Streptomyces sp. NPDC047097 TaxID=3155260 RepID=UPI0034039E33
MSKNIAERVAALSTAESTDIAAFGRVIDLYVAEGDFAWIGALGAEIGGVEDVQWQHEVTLDRILRALADTPTPEALRTLLRVPASLRAKGIKPASAERRLATLVAYGHHIEDIEQVVFAEESESVHSLEFSACLLHELVVIAGGVGQHPALHLFHASLVTEGHPLAVLPLDLLSPERGLRKPPQADDNWTWAVPPTPLDAFAAPDLHATPLMRQRTQDIDIIETTTTATGTAMGAAVQHWRDQSNGLIAAQEFWSPDPVAPEDFAAVFERLPLMSWPEEPPAQLYTSTAEMTLRILFSAAVRSPAYGPGLYSAYGRLAVWRSLGGLTGAPADAPLAHIAELVEQTHWFRVAPTSSWFQQVAWDLSIAALRPGGQEIAVLAATDTD